MKTLLKIALCALVAAFIMAGCCCDCKKDDKEKKPVVRVNYITGKIKLIDGKIKAHIKIKVATDKFKVIDHKVINYDIHKGIVLRYENTVDPELEDDDIKATISYDIDIPNDFKDEEGNPVTWSVNDQIRIMAINDDDKSILKKLLPYFYSRMINFEGRSATADELDIFNKGWNNSNPRLQVKSFNTDKKPRIAKGDIILGIK